MDQILEIIKTHGGGVPIGMILLYIILRIGKAGGVPTVTIHWGKTTGDRREESQSAATSHNGGNGNGNGKLTKAEVAELIGAHKETCHTELYKHIDEFNRSLGRIEGRLQTKTRQ